VSTGQDADGRADDRLVLVWNGRVEELAGVPPRTLDAPVPDQHSQAPDAATPSKGPE
jgi:hypothetical protein